MTRSISFAWAPVLDRTGVIASIGCAVHCLVAPLVILAAPVLGGWWVHPMTHVAIAVLVLPIALFALYRGFVEHRRRWILAAGGVGMLLVATGVVLPWFDGDGESGGAAAAAPAECSSKGDEHAVCRSCCPTVQVDAASGEWDLKVPAASIVTMLGGMALVTAHVGNLRCRCGRCRVLPDGTDRHA